MQHLVIFLRTHDPERPGFAILDDNAGVMEFSEFGEASALTAAAKDRMVTVVVPAEDVLLTAVELPKMNRSRMLQAIPFALEEQIIEDVEQMHFAAGLYHAGEQSPVVVAARAKMKAWLAGLQAMNITPDVMIPAIYAVPHAEGSWHALVNDVAVVRTGLISGFACDKNNIGEMLSLALSTATVQPQQIDLDSAHTAALQIDLPAPVNLRQVTTNDLLEMMARQAVTTPPVNMLQGDFQSKRSRGLPKLGSVVKIGAYLAAVWIFLLFLYPVVSFAILNQRASEIKDQIAVIYKRHFPNSSSIVAPRDRMQQKINKLNADLGDNRFLLMMASVGKGLSQATGVTLKRLDFQNNVMLLEISAASSEIFSNFTDALTQQGLRVKQQNANLNGTRVNATLEIE